MSLLSNREGGGLNREPITASSIKNGLVVLSSGGEDKLRVRKRDWCACPPVPRSLLIVQHRHHAWSLYLNIPKDEVLLVFDRSDLYAAAKYERRDEHNANSYCFHWQTSYWGLAYPCGNHHLHESVIVERTNLHWLRPFKHPLR